MTKIDWERIEKSNKREDHRLVWRPYGWPEIANLEKSALHDAPVSEKWDIPEKLIVSVAITGSFFRRDKNPNQPYTVDEIRQSAREVMQAGASTVHIHVRDENGYNCCSHDKFKSVIEPLQEEFPDLAADACMVTGLKGEWDEMQRVLKDGFLRASPVNPTATYIGDSLMAKPAPILMEKTRKLLEAGAKPEIAVYTDGDVSNADRFLIRSGLIETPAVWLVLPALPGCSPMNNPRQMVESLTRMVNAIRDIDPEGLIMVCAAGRASMMLATFAATMGLHIRIGMEDTYYLWPHREDLIESNLQCMELAKNISAAVGRPIATPREYREMTGI